MATARLVATGFERSKSQLQTPGDGNCMFHSLMDQCSYDK
jgi:hypothetical protein